MAFECDPLSLEALPYCDRLSLRPQKNTSTLKRVPELRLAWAALILLDGQANGVNTVT